MYELDVKGGGDVLYWRKKVFVINIDVIDLLGDVSISE